MRADVNLKQRYRAILSYTGLILLLGGLLMLTPLLALVAWPGEWIHSMGFILPAIVLCGIGTGVWRVFRPRKPVILTVQEGGVVVLLSWVTVCLFSALPLIAVQGLNFTQAVFESVSGWTTTGLSVIDVTQTTHLILLWRSIMQLVGGAGLAIMMLAAIAGPVGPGLSVAEGRSEQLVPHVRESAKLVIVIYTGYAVVGIVAYWLAGMTPFDAVNHAFPAISTGGFSTQPESIGHWNSVAIEAVTLALMTMGNLNFLTAYLLLHGKWKAVYRNGEVRLMMTVIPAGALILFLLVGREIYPTLGEQIRVAIFETVSALTTTGFSTTSYSNWNSVGVFVLTVLMLIGGGTCSTAGGIKQYRIYLLFKSLLWDIRRPLLPRTAVVENYVWQGERKDFINDSRIREVATFVFLYLATYLVGSGILAAHGYGIGESLFEFASALGTTGLSIGVTTAHSPSLALWTETLGMFFGRLEFFVIFVGLAKIIRDSFAMLR
ncbi:TrkH family potassium uptake protein [Candidatus Poribacteria bacterium]|nr:TrkH family potassium uptake protein [Candidatus Poribacteria bacterium]